MNNLHKPLIYKNPTSNNNVVVYIHGFMGSPRQFDYLAEAVQKHGCGVSALLLPGHGGNAKDFASGTFERWQNHVNNEIDRLSGGYENIWLVGHSMGGLLAINCATRYCNRIKGILTIACPFKKTTFSFYALKIRMRQIFCNKNNPMKAAYFSNKSISLSLSFLWHWIKPTKELEKLTNAARKNLPDICVPITAIYSTSDELTSMSSIEIFKSGLSGTTFKPVILTESLHAYYSDHDERIIIQELEDLIRVSSLTR